MSDTRSAHQEAKNRSDYVKLFGLGTLYA